MSLILGEHKKKITTKFLIADLTLTVIQHTHTISTPRTPWTMIKRNFLDIKIMTVDNVATVPFVLPVTLLLLAHPSRKFVDLAMNVRPIRSLFKRLFYDWQGKDVFYKQRKKSKSIVRIFYLDTKGMKKEIVRAPCSAIDLSLFFEEKNQNLPLERGRRNNIDIEQVCFGLSSSKDFIPVWCENVCIVYLSFFYFYYFTECLGSEHTHKILIH